MKKPFKISNGVKQLNNRTVKQGFTRQNFLPTQIWNKFGAGEKKNLGGFTLVEMMVAVLVFSIIIASISGIFVFGIREQRKILTSQILLDQVSYALEYMSRSLRMAAKELNSPLTTCLTTYGSNYETYDSGTRLRFINHLQGDDCQEFYLENNQLKYKREAASTTPKTFELTSNDLKVTFLKFDLSGQSQTDKLQPRVSFYLEIEGKGFPTAQPKLKIQSSVSQRMPDAQY